MTRIAVCDDEEKIRRDIATKAGKAISFAEISLFENGQVLVDSFKKASFDIVLLDIDMPEINGLDVAGLIQNAVPKPLIIFVTSHDELVYDSLRFHPFGFVRKTHLEEELDRVFADAVAEMNSREKSISVHTARGDVRLRLKDVLYFEADGNYIKVFVKDESDEATYRFRDTMQALEATLVSDGFVRVHKGFLVNSEAVKIFNSDKCILTNDMEVPVGRSFCDEARREFMRSTIK
ncbi:MAG: LytTR family DNA-binding domain-containing protein [Lachnospiraceae bacterium]|nr:LytTR family DNA-binding domain-containing protein [Lachnospiraceae bacterium]